MLALITVQWYDSPMKYLKQTIIAGVTSLALVGGASAYQLYPREDNTLPVATVATEAETEEVVPKQDETAPIEETANPAPLPATEPVVSPRLSTPILTREEVWKKVFLTVMNKTAGDPTLSRRNSSFTTAIMSKFETKQQLFTDQSLENTVDRCISHIKTIPDYYEATSSLARNECGL